ncbi:pollen-specific leucine-rich repeat extensin-like protein 1 isoform X2 [Portunus trituberculatus]|uniref:pollen-specific leucine-rich repeat extensin-like protein 1 isoform X2 n=1 Tax=Portunus trituberculatus TaxID=210409 RepID=UPI001E1CD631|nr:pollen-specific leucine-rich repeat extensin-like protein 1 isoform X2 [Portunus trituberculatus]
MAARLLVALTALAITLADHPHVSHPPATSVHVQRVPVIHASQAPAVHRAPAPAVHVQRHPVRHSPGPAVRHPVPHPFSTPQPTYGHHPTRPTYRPRPTYAPTTPAYGAHPHGPAPAPSYGSDQPACAATSSKPWCLEDRDYPTYEIQAAAEQNADKLLTLYADVADLNTELSVDLPSYQTEETYLCPSETAYVRPLRAINTEGKWRIIVNGIKVHYETLTQTTRLEECLNPGYPCPLVPQCYESKCLQKSIYHRFLVYDPYDQYFPSPWRPSLPASCACLLGASTLDH